MGRAVRWVGGLVAVTMLVLLLVVAALAFNVWRLPPPQPRAQVAASQDAGIDAPAARLAQAVRFRTISYDPAAPDAERAERERHAALTAMQAWLREQYPRVFDALRVEPVDGDSLLLRWAGSDPALAPVMLMAHQDVVPVAPGTEGDWTHPPFEGVRADGFVWGRGAWDDKGSLIGQLEAVDALLAVGHVPRRTLYLAYGHDEEMGGEQGAARIAAHLAAQGVRLDFVLDEGLLVTEGIVPGIARPVALVGLAEKGYLTVELRARGATGHSSMPPPGRGAVGALAGVLDALARDPMPARIRGVSRQMFDALAPETSGFMRVALANLWLLEPLVRTRLEGSAGTQASIRTTTAMTVLEAGDKENVLPARARALVNFRLLPGDSIADVLAHVRVHADPAGVEVIVHEQVQNEASPVSSVQARGYRLIAAAARATFDDVVVAPGLMIGATDSRHLVGISDQIYRLLPVRAGPDDLPRFHGTDERLSEANLAEMVAFYRRLLATATAD